MNTLTDCYGELLILSTPTLLLVRGFRFIFYSNENNEPIHVHIAKGGAESRIWLHPIVEVVYSHGFTKSEEKDIMEITLEHVEYFKTKWNEYFDK